MGSLLLVSPRKSSLAVTRENGGGLYRGDITRLVMSLATEPSVSVRIARN